MSTIGNISSIYMEAKFKSFLKKHDTFTTSQAEEAGFSRMTLSLYNKKGLIERVSRGLYRNPEIESKVPIDKEDLVAVARSIPNGVICLISALDIYEMTEEIPRAHWIAVSNSRQAPRRKGAHIVRFRNMKLGKTKMKIGDKEILIFDRERTVIDAFRYLSVEIAIKALKSYLQPTRTHKPNFNKLTQYSQLLHKDITPYILALTT